MKIFYSSKIYFYTTIFTLIFFQAFTVFGQGCDCAEYAYVNETTNGGEVHKYTINADGSLSEILNNGNAWYPGANTSEMPSPHGLTLAVNGNFFIGEGISGGIRKLNCAGEIVPSSEFEINSGGYNFHTIGNTIYTNPRSTDEVRAYDLCTGTFINAVCFNGTNGSSWGFDLADDGTFYVSDGLNSEANGGSKIYKFTEADFGTGVCVDPLFTSLDDNTSPSIGDNYLPDTNARGITYVDGFLYFAEFDNGGAGYRILKIDATTGVVVDASAYDTVNGDGGWNQIHGIVYSETSNLLYVSTFSISDDCVSLFNLDLDYLGPAIPATGFGADSRAKGIDINVECCPTPAVQNISETFCANSLPLEINLNDAFPCEGTICEGSWDLLSQTGSVNFNDCAHTVEFITSGSCINLNKTSDGDLSNSGVNQCGAFNITLNLCFYKSQPCSTPDEFTFQKRRP